MLKEHDEMKEIVKYLKTQSVSQFNLFIKKCIKTIFIKESIYKIVSLLKV